MGVLVEYLTEKCIACNAYVADPKEMCVKRDPHIRNIEGDYVRLGGIVAGDVGWPGRGYWSSSELPISMAVTC